MGLTVDSESQPEGAWSVSQPWRRVPYIHYAPKPYSSYSDCMHQFESCTQHAHAQFPYLLPCSNPLRVAAFSRAGSSIAQVFVGSLRLLRAASDMRRRRLVKRGTIEMGMMVEGQGRKHAKQKALVGVLAEIPVDGVGNSGRLSGARVRCVVPGNVERVVELCVGAGDFVLALVWFIVNAKVAKYVAAAARVRVAALDLSCHHLSQRSVGRGLDPWNHAMSAAVGAWSRGDVIFLCMRAPRFFCAFLE